MRKAIDRIGRKTGGNVKVSVLMITYNHEKYIEQAIESVLMQDVDFDYELLIGEDCSNDRTREIVRSYQVRYPDRIGLLLPRRNLGDGGRRIMLKVFEASHGDYLALLEGDDYWTSPGKLTKQVRFLEQHPECSICFHDVAIVNEDGRPLVTNANGREQKPFTTAEDLLGADYISTCSAMLRRLVFGAHPKWSDIAAFGDWTILTVFAQRGKIGYLRDNMGAYRQHKNGFWTAANLRQQIEHIINCYETMNAKTHFAYREQIRQLVSQSCYELAEEDAKCGRKFLPVLPQGSWLYAHPILFEIVRRTEALLSASGARLVSISRALSRGKSFLLKEPTGKLRADPNPTPRSGVLGTGSTTLSWRSVGTSRVEVKVESPDGPLFASTGPCGQQTTGEWVDDGMVFYLLDVSDTHSPEPSRILDWIRVAVSGGPQYGWGIMRRVAFSGRAKFESLPASRWITQKGSSPNTLHLKILMCFSISWMGGEMGWFRRRGKLLIFRFTPRGLRRPRLETTRSSSISSSTASWNAFSVPRGE